MLTKAWEEIVATYQDYAGDRRSIQALAAQYSFQVLCDRQGYIRADYQYQGKQNSLTA
jgi:hypothetical protein